MADECEYAYYEEEVVEEEYVDEVDDGSSSLGDEDFLASIKESLLAEARQRQAGKEINKAAGEQACSTGTGTGTGTSSVAAPPLSPPPEPEPISVDIHAANEKPAANTKEPQAQVLAPEFEYEETIEDSESCAKQDVKAMENSVEDDEEEDDEHYLDSIQASMQKLFRERKAAFAAAAAAASPKIAATDSTEGEDNCSEYEYEYEEQVVERWFERDPEPEDMEAACRALIPIVYKGETMNAETMMRRTPLLELYKYLKQHYDYKKEVKQDLTEEETKSGEAQTTLESLFKKRHAANSITASTGAETGRLLVPGEESAQAGSGLSQEGWHGKSARKDTQSSRLGNTVESGSSFEDSQVLDGGLLIDSTTDFGGSSILMGESGRSFEEFIEEETENEETVREDTECEFVEETLREDDEDEILEETVREDDD